MCRFASGCASAVTFVYVKCHWLTKIDYRLNIEKGLSKSDATQSRVSPVGLGVYDGMTRVE